MGGTVITVCVCSSIAYGALLDRLKCYRRMFIGVAMLILMSGLAAVFLLPTGKFFLVMIDMVFIGMSGMPILTVSLCFGNRLSFPLHPSISNTTIMFCYNLAYFLLAYLVGFLANLKAEYAVIGLATLAFIPGILCWFVKEDFFFHTDTEQSLAE